VTTLLGLDLRGRRVLVAGGGVVAGRRARRFAADGADVVVVAPALRDERLEHLVRGDQVTWLPRPVQQGDIQGSWLVLAATDDPATNDAVAQWAHAAHVWCIHASQARAGSARMAASSQHGEVLLGVVSDGGVDPARVAAVRDALADHLDSGAVDLRRRRR